MVFGKNYDKNVLLQLKFEHLRFDIVDDEKYSNKWDEMRNFYHCIEEN